MYIEDKEPILRNIGTGLLFNNSSGIINLVIIQIIHIDSLIFLILRPAISYPAVRVVVDIFILKVLPTRMRQGIQCVERRACKCQLFKMTTTLEGRKKPTGP